MPRIVYVSWPATEITGGIKAAFQHAEMLAEAGMDAAVATPDGTGPSWFATRAKVIPHDEVRTTDVLVLPENNGRFLATYAASPQPKLVYLQNPYLACQGLAGRRSYADYGVSRLMAPSMTVVQFCQRRFPGMKVGYTPFYIDHSRFAFTPSKTLQIAVMPRKRMLEFGAIADLLCALYPEFAEVKWMYLHGATEQEVAAALARSAVFLSLQRLEAHGMTALEAMASGCIVAGFTGVYGGNDSATARNGFWAAEDDVHGCVDQLARALRVAREGGETCRLMQEEGRLTALQYRREESARQLLAFWRHTLAELSPA